MSEPTQWTVGWAALGSPSPRPSPLGRGRMIHSHSIILVPGFGQRPSAKHQSIACCSLSLRERVRLRGNYSVEHAKCCISQRLLSLYKGVQIANNKPHRQKQLRILGHTHLHPGPLSSYGRGRIVLRRPAYPTASEAARDGAACSLSRRTGEGQGEGRLVRNTPPVRHLLLYEPL